MGLDAMESQPELQELRLRIERLEREVSALRHQQGGSAGAVPLPSGGIGVALPRESTPPPPPKSQPALKLSIENRLGSQWFSRIGIIALLIATALILKLAFDNHWIGPLGRILAGLIAGAGVIVWSERFRRQGVTAFSYALKAIGSGVLYLTLWAAFQLYGLMPAPVAFGAMLLVTAWNAYMAWSQDAELLAAYALIGGFATPALLSTGQDHELFLFSYLAALDLAVIALVRLKSWPRLLVAAFLPTVTYYTAWYFESSAHSHAFWLTTVFVSLFFIIFASASTSREQDHVEVRSSLIPDVLLPLANAVFIALALYGLLDPDQQKVWPTWIAVLLAAIYLGLVRVSRSATASAVHLSLAILFLTVAIPLKATGHGIVIGWLVEGAALLWVSARLPHEGAVLYVRGVLRWLACATLALGFLAVITTPVWSSNTVPIEAFLNWRFATGMIGVAAFASAIFVALHPQREPDDMHPGWLQIAAFASIAFNLVAVWSVVQEIATFWRDTAGNADASLQKDLAISAFLALYGAALLAVGFRTRRAFIRWQALILLVFTIGKTFLYDMHSLSLGYRAISLLGLGALLMAVSFAYQKDLLGLREPSPAVTAPKDSE